MGRISSLFPLNFLYGIFLMKYKRDRKRLKAARSLVAYWYKDRRINKRAVYYAVHSKPVMTAADFKLKGDGHWVSNHQLGNVEDSNLQVPLTADGKQTADRKRHNARPLKQPISLHTQGNYKQDRLLVFAISTMEHVQAISPEYHAALEMDAAGYSAPDIAGELGCGDNLARQLVEGGLAVVMSYQEFRAKKGFPD